MISWETLGSDSRAQICIHFVYLRLRNKAHVCLFQV